MIAASMLVAALAAGRWRYHPAQPGPFPRSPPIFMSCTTSSHVLYARNWAQQLVAHVPGARHLIWCLDKEGCLPPLRGAGLNAEYLASVDDGWRTVKTWFGVAKFIGALELIERGEHVIVTDGDFVVRKDVTNLLHHTHDIEMQGGIFKDADLWRHFYSPKAYNSVLCIGFLSMLPTAPNVAFLREYLRRKKGPARAVWDQQLFNDMLLRNVSYGEVTLPTVRVIDANYLPAGQRLLYDSSKLEGAYAVHPSGQSHEAKDYKRYLFRESGAWKGEPSDSEYRTRTYLLVDGRFDAAVPEDLEHLRRAVRWGLFLAKELNRTFILPAVYCAPSLTPLFHAEMFEPAKLFRIHGDRIMPPAFADDPAAANLLTDRKRLQLPSVSGDDPVTKLISELKGDATRVLQLDARNLPDRAQGLVVTAYQPGRVRAMRCGKGGVAAIRPPWVPSSKQLGGRGGKGKGRGAVVVGGGRGRGIVKPNREGLTQKTGKANVARKVMVAGVKKAAAGKGGRGGRGGRGGGGGGTLSSRFGKN